jgi:hypothetical protein
MNITMAYRKILSIQTVLALPCVALYLALISGCEAFGSRNFVAKYQHQQKTLFHAHASKKFQVNHPVASASITDGSDCKLHKLEVKENRISWDTLKMTCLSISFSMFLMAASPAFAGGDAFDPSLFTNDYSDPLHPMCKRHIEVAADGKTFHYSGTAVGPKDDPVLRGCSQAEMREYKLRKGEFDGIILDNNRVSAGDGIHEGVWEPAGSVPSSRDYADVDGIRWNDGNKWIVERKGFILTAGETIFYLYIGFSTLAGAKGIYDGILRKKREAEEQLV